MVARRPSLFREGYGYNEYRKEVDMQYFKMKEFECRCWCGMPEEAKVNIEAMVSNVLDPVRAKFGKPIKVNSGYRCKKHNAEVGGSPRSQHMCQGGSAAADICAEPRGYTNMTDWKQANMEIAGLIVKNGKFDQIILENVGANDLKPKWVHVSFNRNMNRGQVLKKVAGQKGYAALTADEISKLLGGGFRAK